MSNIDWSEVTVAYAATVDDAELMVKALTPTKWRWELHRPGWHEEFGDYKSKEEAMRGAERGLERSRTHAPDAAGGPA